MVAPPLFFATGSGLFGGAQVSDCSSMIYLSKLIYLSPSPAEEEGAEGAER